MFLGAPPVSWWFLAGAMVGAWFTWQAVRPVRLPSLLAIPSFFAGWLANELAVHHLAWQLVATIAFVAAGAMVAWPGWLGMALVVAQWIAAASLIRAAARTPAVAEAAVIGALGPSYRSSLPDARAGWDRIRWAPLVLPLLVGHRDVVRRRDVRYARASARDLFLDVFAPRTAGERRPALVYLHGGAWTLGFRDRQGLPLLVEAARRGFVGIQPAYRRSPVATFPEHLVDAKRAIAWVREHADELGVDPSFVAVAGGSAGGHLAALAALTHGRRDLQPGFEDADTTVQACVPLYGVFDPTDDLGMQTSGLTDFLATHVIKADLDEAPERWATASPLAQVRPDAPPFLVVHGERDSLTSRGEAEAFASRLSAVSHAGVGMALLPGAQHAFDLFPSIRTAHTTLAVLRFLVACHRQQQDRTNPSDALARGGPA